MLSHLDLPQALDVGITNPFYRCKGKDFSKFPQLILSARLQHLTVISPTIRIISLKNFNWNLL